MKIFRLALALLLLLPAVAHADAWPGNTIGAGFGVQVKPERTDDAAMARIKELGFNYLRYDMHWADVEKQRGRYNWEWFDTFIGRQRAHGLKAVVILNGGNQVFTGRVAMDPAKNFGWPTATRAPTSDADVQAFVDFSVAAIKRYGTKDIIWEIWNEPDGNAFWPPVPDATAFTKLAAATCTALRAAAPDADIVAPGIARLPAANDPPYTAFFSTIGHSSLSQCLTAYSIHPYRFEKSPETVIDDYKNKVRPFIASLTPPGQKPLSFISSEWGYPSNKISEEQQGDYLLRTHLANLLGGVPLSIWYEWRDSRPGPAPDDIEAHFGVVDYDGNDKAGAKAISELLPDIKDAVIESRVPTANVNCFILNLKQPNGTHQILAWVDNEQMVNGTTLTTGITSSDHSYKLTTRPQLFPDAADSHTTCK